VIIRELSEAAQSGFKLLSNLYEDFNSDLDVSKDVYSTFFKVFFSQMDALDSVLSLLEKNKYKDSFILLRHAYETYFYFLLMLEGRKYRQTRRFYIIPNKSTTEEEARDETLKKWRKEWKEWKEKRTPGLELYDAVENLSPCKNNAINVTYKMQEGLFEEKDEKKEGEIITMYYFVFHNYDPFVNFLGSLPSIVAGDMFPDITKRHQEEQQMVYNRYFFFENMITNLISNNLITQYQSDYLRVHYNFLSTYVHITREIIKIVPNAYSTGIENGTDDVNAELILLYVCSLQNLFLKTFIKYLNNQKNGDWSKKYDDHNAILEKLTDDVWFIFNSPNKYDIESSERKKRWIEARGIKTDKDKVIYYENPLEHLRGLRSFQNR